MPGTATVEISGIEKAAVLMVSLGTQRSAEVFKHLSQDEIRKLSAGIIALKRVDPGMRASVLREFARARAVVTARPEASRNFAADLIESAIQLEASPASFEDLAVLDTASMKNILAAADRHELCLALKGADDRVKNAVFGSMTDSEAAALKSEIEQSGAVKLREIEQAQAKIAAVIRGVKR